MTTPEQLTEAIAHAERELAELNERANSISLLHYRLQAASAGIHLGSHTKAQLQAIQDALNEATQARDSIPVKQSALKMLKTQLQDEQGRQRRLGIQEKIALFDRLKTDYTERSQALLELFRDMYQLHIDVEGASGQRLMSDIDFMLHLPATSGRFDSAAFRTGDIVRGCPIQPRKTA